MLIELTVSYLFVRAVCVRACVCVFYFQKEKAGPREGRGLPHGAQQVSG